MFSNELMRYLIQYQGKEYVKEESDSNTEKNNETLMGFHRFTKYAVIPIKVER